MSTMRPSFEVGLSLGREVAIERFRAALQHSSWNATSYCFDRYAEMHVPPSELRYWSPHLSLYFEGDDHHTKILGRFGPRQEIWTFVCVIYLALAFSTFFSLMFSISMWMLGTFTWWCLVPPIAMLGIAALYWVSRIGQSWSLDQIHQLKAACDHLMERIQ